MIRAMTGQGKSSSDPKPQILQIELILTRHNIMLLFKFLALPNLVPARIHQGDCHDDIPKV